MIQVKKYEVVKLVEHGSGGYIVTDYVPGVLLVQRLREREAVPDKGQILEGFMKLAKELEKYKKCCHKEAYLNLSPYHILLTDEEEIRLLDPNAAGSKAVRQEFEGQALWKCFAQSKGDMEAFGKIIQLVLACTQEKLSFSRKEISMLSRIIEKCSGKNSKKRYENDKQLQQELVQVIGVQNRTSKRNSKR